LSFLKKQTSKGTQIIQGAATQGKVSFQLLQVELNHAKGLEAAMRHLVCGHRHLIVNFALCFCDGLDKKLNVLLGVFDAFKRSFNPRTHDPTSLLADLPVNCIAKKLLNSLQIQRY
jgi:hypothetical protein